MLDFDERRKADMTDEEFVFDFDERRKTDMGSNDDE